MITATTYPLNRTILITAEGLNDIKERILKLRSRRLEISSLLHELGEQQSTQVTIEESSWQETLEKLHMTEAELDALHAVLAKAKIIEADTSSTQINIGSKVSLLHDSKQLDCMIVDSFEANPSAGKISDQSPLGQLLLGKTQGDELELVSPSGKINQYKVLDIS